MTEQQFCYWLQGFVELNNEIPTKEQWKSIQEHLATVFKKITPDYQPRKLSPLNPPYQPLDIYQINPNINPMIATC